MAHDDLVTLLWQANPVRILFEAVPVHQTIYLSTDETDGAGRGQARRGLAYDWSPPDVPGLERLGATRMRQYVRAWINAWDLVRLDPSFVPSTEVVEVVGSYDEDAELS